MENRQATHEKKRAAILSVFAAVLLTGAKLLVGLLTGSLGILSEALHSGLDLIAALITWFSVAVSDKPADRDHHYGHGKIENLSALAETMLLLATCAWIVSEAIRRLRTGELQIEVMVWSYIVVVASILIDFTRSRALMKVAKKHNSQALEADALHFSTDIGSSAVVLIGLVMTQLGWYSADAVAALLVSVIVIFVAYRLGKRSVNVLLDKAPVELVQTVNGIVKEVPGVSSFHGLKIRNAGADVFVELCIHLDPALNITECHTIAHEVERRLQSAIKRCRVHIHQEPEERKENADAE
ncbi:MAG: cation transporter [Planctomycetes bacterium RBG_16_59_8]|nr:MAG: cation transporter [Planctomycetes bacterium RBG_16_59_8]